MEPELTNCMRMAVESGRWGDVARLATDPLRSTLYRLRRRSRGPRTGEVPSVPDPPPLSPAIVSPFASAPAREPRPVDVEALFADADRQRGGALRLAGGRWHESQADSGPAAFADPEDLHAWHRLYRLARLAQAEFWGHPDAGAILAREFQSWCAARLRADPLAFTPYTTAERIASLVQVLFWTNSPASAFSDDLRVLAKQQIWRDAVALSTGIEFALGVHNHLLDDARGLYLASRALGYDTDCRHWSNQAFDLWDKYFPRLVLDDGVLREQSSHYHLLLTRTALEYYLAAQNARRPVAQGFEARLRSMFEFADDLVRADGTLPRFGDNSPDHIAAELRGVLVAAYQHGLLARPPRWGELTTAGLYYGGGVSSPPATPGELPLMKIYPQAGFVILRTADGASELTIHADPDGQARAHGDCGRGSYEFWSGGVVVREPGSFLQPGNAGSRWSRSARAQNVSLFDGLGPAIEPHLHGLLPDWYREDGGCWRMSGGEACFEFHSFRRLRTKLDVRRSWKLLAGTAFRLHETVSGAQALCFESRVCLGGGPWRQSSPSEIRRDSPGAASIAVAGPRGFALRLEPGSYTPEYGVVRDTQVLVIEGRIRPPFEWTLTCVVEPSGAGARGQLEDDASLAVRA